MTISITKPTVGGSENSWGSTTNQALDDIVDVLNGNTASTPDLTTGAWKVGGTAITAAAGKFNKLAGLTASTEELNKVDGLTASTAELNKLDGLTASTAELNRTNGATSNIQAQLDGKPPTSRTISAGGGLTGGGSLASNRTISHSDTSSQSSVNNSGNTVIQDITLDTYGHVTNINSKTIPSNSLNTSNKAWTDGDSGLQIRYGSFSSSTDGDQTVNFTSAFSNSCFVCIVGGEVHTESVSRTSFVVNREDSYSGTFVFQYIALGR